MFIHPNKLLYKFNKLKKFRGKGTELISQYIPGNADRSSVMNALTEEISQSSNIKSPQTRKNVQGALRKIINFLNWYIFSHRIKFSHI